MRIYDLLQEVNEHVEEFIAEHMTEVDPKSCGIDPRACYKLYKGADSVAIRKRDKGSFSYYGAAEYVDKDSVHELGDYVFYDSDDSRVAGWLGDEEEDDPLDNPNYVGSRHHY